MKKLALTLTLCTSFSFAVSIDEIVSNSLQNSSDLRSLNQAIKVANENIKLTSKWSDPILSFGFNDIHFDEPFKRDKEAMQATFIGLSQVIPTNGKLEIKEKIALKDMQIKTLVLEDKKLKLKAKIYELAYSIVVLENKLKLLNEYEKNIKILEDLSKSLYEFGKSTQNEILDTKVLFLNVQIQKQKLKNLIDNLYLKLEQISYMNIDEISQKRIEIEKLVLNMNVKEHPFIKQEYVKSKRYMYLSKLEKANEVPDIKVNVAYFNRDNKFEDYANISVNIPLTINNTQSVKSLKAKFESNKVSSKLDDTKRVLHTELKTYINSANSALVNYELIKNQIIPLKQKIQKSLENYNSFSSVKPQSLIKNLNELISFEIKALDEKFEYFSNYSKTKYYTLED
ncbi:TolC family protein [Arcobacter roscoffensis]|uniref:TolC family protein n=1 Tax=Arcobacter roscoffensis TaxID=2961520 RepID=A0ABY5E379_9BACT|nr:TolC family protein [Arcobacter roscoffensis]UTJ06617.1 TolC family protein [Arcobacter roscoffensis]